MKKFLSMAAMLLMLSACGGDEPDGVYDWNVTKQTYSIQTSGAKTTRTLVLTEYETVYKKTEDQMLVYKLDYESQSHDGWQYKYYYKQIK